MFQIKERQNENAMLHYRGNWKLITQVYQYISELHIKILVFNKDGEEECFLRKKKKK